MPHINRIRVNNVKYNFGTQFYDDFMMRFSCKNTIYDLANGGGKSVLMLLLFQNLIPNCTLDEKQPIEKLFRTNEGSTTIHSLIEWKLSDEFIKDNFKYMLTGFCARKAKDNSETDLNGEIKKNGQAIEYFNYVIFYRKFNDNDIKNLPLSKDGERITYTGLKNYLKELSKNDFSLQIHIFERKGDYQRFIAEYGLYESEWEIIRGINKTEGHVRTYFETNYKNTRKVVEDLFIEEIIEKSFKNNYSGTDENDKLAVTLLNIKDKLIELSKKKDEINNYDRQINIIDGFAQRVLSVKQMYKNMEDTFVTIQKIYNTVADNSDNFEGIRERKNEALEELLLQKKSFRRKSDTAKILVDKKELLDIEKDLEISQEELNKIEDDIATLNESLNMMEGTNHYLEYIDAKNEYDKLVLVMDNILKNNGEILTRLKEAVCVKKLVDNEIKNSIETELNRRKNESLEENKNIENLENRLMAEEKSIAVREYEIAEKNDRLKFLDEEMIRLKNETSILLPAQAETEYKKQLNELEELKIKISEKKSECESLNEEHYRLQFVYENQADKTRRLKERLDEIKEKSKKADNNQDKLIKLREVYQESDNHRLEEKIQKAYRNTVLRLDKEKKEIEEKNKLLSNLERGIPLFESADTKAVVDYIKRYHTSTAEYGAELISGMTEENRIDVIRNNPILLYSVIVYEKAQEILSDTDMIKNLELKSMVPVINAENIEDFQEEITKNQLKDTGNVLCLTGNPGEFKDDFINREYEKLKKVIEDKTVYLDRISENEKVMAGDLSFVKMMNEGFFNDGDTDPAKQFEILSEELKIAEEELLKFKIDADKFDDDKVALENEIKDLESLATEKTDILKKLICIKEDIEQYRGLQRDKDILSEAVNTDKKALSEQNIILDNIKTKHDENAKRIENLSDELEGIDKEWQEKYETYFDTSIYDTIVHEDDNKSLTEIKEQFVGKESLDITLSALLQALRGKNSSVSDKEKLLGTYQMSMQRSLMRLDYLGIPKDKFDILYEKKELFPVKHQKMQEIKTKEDELKSQRKVCLRLIDEKKSKRDKLQGKINHLIETAKSEYGEFDENIVDSSEITSFITENEKLSNALNDRIAVLNAEIKDLNDKKVINGILLKNCDRLMKKSSIKVAEKTVRFEEISADELENKYNDASEKIDKFVKDKYSRLESFERELQMLCDTLKMLGAEGLSSEFRGNIRMPQSMDDVDVLIDSLMETNKLISLEKDRVQKGLTDIKLTKENFENQCIQTCINIKTDLERLGRLSRITIDGENVSMVKLKIPYVDEELYKDRMSDYIDTIAKDVDGLEDKESRLKFIRNNLSWKKLFSVIVTDMNRIKLSLYKRERIAAQSRYLPYEEAVGSTGQSQGIYIQFLISVINYISSINSKNANSMGIRKVIFIDNPFGAAKDSYIWEPIFKLMKVNNVQLVVPARGATPAITGKFDVNYILGQKMIGGKQQTVVVNYFSNVKTDELDYTTLSFEQTALF